MTKLIRSGSRSSSQLLARILERSELVAVVDKLSPPVLGQLIEHVGLEDAGELVAMASTQQLERVWDRDLWARVEGQNEERFDPERFALWLAVMLEAGEAQTVERLCALPFDLLTLAVHRLVRVLDQEAFAQLAEDDDDDDEEASGLYMPWHELVLIARDDDAWDAVMTALLALDEQDHALLRRVLGRCCEIDAEAGAFEDDESAERSDDAMLERDVAGERDVRQAATGFVSASDARSFLELARTPSRSSAAELERDPVTRAYFRELADGDQLAAPGAGERDDEHAHEHEPVHDEHAHETGTLALRENDQAALSSLLGLLADSGVLAAPPQAVPIAWLPAGTAVDGDAKPDPTPADAPSLLHAALHVLATDAPVLWSERMEELGYLANVVLAGCLDGERAFEPRAALEAATAVCNLGLELQLPRNGRESLAGAVDVLRNVSADRLFRAGYATLPGEIGSEAWHLLQQRAQRSVNHPVS